MGQQFLNICCYSSSRHRFGCAGRLPQAPCLDQHLPEKVLDLSVQAAQVVVRPALQRLMDRGIQAKEERFPLSHDFGVQGPGAPALVQRSRVHDRLAAPLAAEHHEQVAHHGESRRSGSSCTMFRVESMSSAFSTMPTAPSTILKRAAMIALACWRCSMAEAISGA